MAKLASLAIFLVTARALWRALYGSADQFAGVSRDDMATYAMMAMLVGPHPSVLNEVIKRVRSGNIALVLLWPMDFQVFTYLRVVAHEVAGWITGFAAAFVFGVLWLGLEFPPSIVSGGAFLLSMGLSLLILLSMDFIIGCLAILYLEISGLVAVKNVLTGLLAGQLVPLWFFPDWYAQVAAGLPFASLTATPCSIYCGILTGGSMVKGLLLQAAWATGLAWLARVSYRRLDRYVVIQGG